MYIYSECLCVLDAELPTFTDQNRYSWSQKAVFSKNNLYFALFGANMQQQNNKTTLPHPPPPKKKKK